MVPPEASDKSTTAPPPTEPVAVAAEVSAPGEDLQPSADRQAERGRLASRADAGPAGGGPDGWYLLWEVGDREATGRNYRWRNEHLEKLPHKTDQATEQLLRALRTGEAQQADTAAIGLARLGDSSQLDRLVQIVRNPDRSLPMRRAAVESLARLELPSVVARLDQLLGQYGRFESDGRSTYLAGLHAELIRARARHVSAADDPRFIEALSSPDKGVRIAAIEVWAHSAVKSLPDEIVALIDDQPPDVRVAALDAVARRGDAAALPQVLKAAKTYDLPVRLQAIRTLGALGGPEARSALLDTLRHGGEQPRMAAVGALAQAGDRTTVYAAATDASWRVRRQVATALAKDASPRAIEVARTLLEDNSIEVAAKVLEGLQQWPLAKAAPLLLDAVDSRAKQVRRMATAQLVKRWEPAHGLNRTMTVETRRKLLADLKQQCQSRWTAEDKVAGRDAAPAMPDGQGAASEIPEDEIARIKSLLQDYLNAGTDEQRASLRADLSGSGLALRAVCERMVLEHDQPLDDRVYSELLAAVDPPLATIERLRDDDVNQRREAARLLAKSSARQPLSPLALHRLARVAVSEPDTDVWRAILETIASQGSEPAKRVALAATSHQSPDIRRRACVYLQQHGSPAHASVLVPMLRDPDVAVVRAAVRALGACRSLPDVRPLKALLASTDKTLCVEVAVALTRLGSASGPAALQRLSYDSQPSVRQQVAAALGQLGDPACLPTLIRLLDDQPSVRRAALDALPKVVDTPLPAEDGSSVKTPQTVARRWQDWYRQRGLNQMLK